MRLIAMLISSLALAELTAFEHDGVDFPARIEVGGERLVPRGGHTFTWGLWTIHRSVLYAPENVAAADLASGDRPLAMVVCYARSFERAEQTEALRESLREAHGEDTVAIWLELASRFGRGYPAEVEEDDVVTYRYAPGAGIELMVDGEVVSAVADDAFGTAVFAIWIGSEPVDEDMREDLLGLGD